MGGKSKKKDKQKNDVEALLKRASEARKRSSDILNAPAPSEAPVAAKPAKAEAKPVESAPQQAAAEVKSKEDQAGPTAASVPEVQVLDEMPSTKLPDRVVIIVGGRHYVAPIGKKHPVEVAKHLYGYISRVE